jgi:hypothetical protein
MEQILIQNARAFASKHQLQLAERLGFGVHGIILVAEGNSKTDLHRKTAVKVLRSRESYARERDIYQRLKEAGVSEVLGFHVPQLIHFDDELMVIEMSIVTRPFVLDFAGAHLHQRPEFPAETWVEWEIEKRDQFDDRWPKVQEVLAGLEALGIFMVDVSPNNIGFLD